MLKDHESVKSQNPIKSRERRKVTLMYLRSVLVVEGLISEQESSRLSSSTLSWMKEVDCFFSYSKRVNFNSHLELEFYYIKYICFSSSDKIDWLII